MTHHAQRLQLTCRLRPASYRCGRSHYARPWPTGIHLLGLGRECRVALVDYAQPCSFRR